MKIRLQEILNGQILTRDTLKKQYKLIGLAALLLVVYIYAGYYAQTQFSRMTQMQKELKEAEYELQTLQSELTEITKQSALADELKKRDSKVKESTQSPKRIR